MRSSIAAVSTASPAKAVSPAAEGEIGCQDQRASLVTASHDLEEEIGLLSAHRQVSDLIDDQELVGVDRPMHHFAITALALGGFQHQHQVGGAEETGLVAALGGEITQCNREMGLANARWSEQHHVLGS